jgi:quercetin dioxygenase-like cupin family protein
MSRFRLVNNSDLLTCIIVPRDLGDLFIGEKNDRANSGRIIMTELTRRRVLAMRFVSAVTIAGFAVLSSLGIAARAQAPDVMALSPSEMKWSAQGGLALPGLEQTTLVGDPSKPGPYTIRLKFPAGFKVAPHTHPDSREVTILSGTWYTGYGEKAEAAGLKELPAGSFYTEPANVAHYVEVREPTLIQVSGTGPSGRKFVGPDAPK